jgi:hypothetical protein
MKYDFRGEVPRADGKPLYESYPETRAAIAEYYGNGRSIEWLRKTQEAFARESSIRAEEIGTMTPSYIRWLIDGGKSMY